MPFQSKAQAAYLYANNPKVAKEFAANTPANAKLPDHVSKNNHQSSSAPTPERKAAAMSKLLTEQGR